MDPTTAYPLIRKELLKNWVRNSQIATIAEGSLTYKFFNSEYLRIFDLWNLCVDCGVFTFVNKDTHIVSW